MRPRITEGDVVETTKGIFIAMHSFSYSRVDSLDRYHSMTGIRSNYTVPIEDSEIIRVLTREEHPEYYL